MIFFELKQRQIQTLGVSGKSLEMARTGHRCEPLILSTTKYRNELNLVVILHSFGKMYTLQQTYLVQK